jgi:hypothetical protein
MISEIRLLTLHPASIRSGYSMGLRKAKEKRELLAMAYSRMQKPHTTIGAGGLNCRVRDGTGCDPAAQITNNSLSWKQCLVVSYQWSVTDVISFNDLLLTTYY